MFQVQSNRLRYKDFSQRAVRVFFTSRTRTKDSNKAWWLTCRTNEWVSRYRPIVNQSRCINNVFSGRRRGPLWRQINHDIQSSHRPLVHANHPAWHYAPAATIGGLHLWRTIRQTCRVCLCGYAQVYEYRYLIVCTHRNVERLNQRRRLAFVKFPPALNWAHLFSFNPTWRTFLTLPEKMLEKYVHCL